MQFFQFQLSKLWIFFGLSVILTVLTILGWWWSTRKRRAAEVDTDEDDSDMVWSMKTPQIIIVLSCKQSQILSKNCALQNQQIISHYAQQ